MSAAVEEDESDELPTQHFVVEAIHRGARLDSVLAQLLPEHSRSRLQQWIRAGAVRVNGAVARPRAALVEGDLLEVQPVRAPDEQAFGPEPMPLDIVYEDDSLIVIDKPAGLVVHPGAGNWSGTLLNGLLAYDARLSQVPRAGIVHRLDADTSGLMVVARSQQAHTDLVRQLQARSVLREYWAIVFGAAPLSGTVEAPLGRDPRNPVRFAVSHAPAAREAKTTFRRVQCVSAGARQLSWVACRLQTGRTHQIRVHLESIRHPLVGDPLYRRTRPATSTTSTAPWDRFARQALHACRLAFVHPDTETEQVWFRAPPVDMQQLMRASGFTGVDRPQEVFG